MATASLSALPVRLISTATSWASSMLPRSAKPPTCIWKIEEVQEGTVTRQNALPDVVSDFKKKENYHVGAAYFQSVELVVEVGLVCHLGLFEPLLVLHLLCSHGADLTEDPLRR